MRGTNSDHPRCAMLRGEIGVAIQCGIYENRPGPCRAFGVTWTDGELVTTPQELARCNRARAKWSLPPLEVPGI